MSQITIKEAVREIQYLDGGCNHPLIRVMRPWMVITGLSLEDAIHLNYDETVRNLVLVHRKLGELLDILDEDQLQETACRCLKEIVVYGELVTDGDTAIRQRQVIAWDGDTWQYITDPKLRQRGSSKSYVTALADVREAMGG